MQGVEERRLRRMNNTPQGGAIEDNAADDILMVDQGVFPYLTFCTRTCNYAESKKIDFRNSRCDDVIATTFTLHHGRNV